MQFSYVFFPIVVLDPSPPSVTSIFLAFRTPACPQCRTGGDPLLVASHFPFSTRPASQGAPKPMEVSPLLDLIDDARPRCPAATGWPHRVTFCTGAREQLARSVRTAQRGGLHRLPLGVGCLREDPSAAGQAGARGVNPAAMITFSGPFRAADSCGPAHSGLCFHAPEPSLLGAPRLSAGAVRTYNGFRLLVAADSGYIRGTGMVARLQRPCMSQR